MSQGSQGEVIAEQVPKEESKQMGLPVGASLDEDAVRNGGEDGTLSQGTVLGTDNAAATINATETTTTTAAATSAAVTADGST